MFKNKFLPSTKYSFHSNIDSPLVKKGYSPLIFFASPTLTFDFSFSFIISPIVPFVVLLLKLCKKIVKANSSKLLFILLLCYFVI